MLELSAFGIWYGIVSYHLVVLSPYLHLLKCFSWPTCCSHFSSYSLPCPAWRSGVSNHLCGSLGTNSNLFWLLNRDFWGFKTVTDLISVCQAELRAVYLSLAAAGYNVDFSVLDVDWFVPSLAPLLAPFPSVHHTPGAVNVAVAVLLFWFAWKSYKKSTGLEPNLVFGPCTAIPVFCEPFCGDNQQLVLSPLLQEPLCEGMIKDIFCFHPHCSGLPISCITLCNHIACTGADYGSS